MKDYIASGPFVRDKEEKAASASMAFVGNINQSVDVLRLLSAAVERVAAPIYAPARRIA
jgi:predicted ATP-dependent Lon-type protease